MNINTWLLISNFFLIHSCIGADNGSSSDEPFEFQPRIVGGRDAKVTDRPFQVSLQRPTHFCGGTIISKRYIVTAAHCVDGEDASDLKVVVGTIDLRKPYRTYQASHIIIHEGYKPEYSHIHDIALVKVSRPIAFNDIVKPVRLPRHNIQLYIDDDAIVSGWGYKSAFDKKVSNILQEVEIKIAGLDYCKRVMWRKGYQIYRSQLCAFNEDRRQGHCRGDSGGPLTLDDGTLIGIVSWSIKDPECASTTYPGVYTRVTRYIHWIMEKEHRHGFF